MPAATPAATATMDAEGGAAIVGGMREVDLRPQAQSPITSPQEDDSRKTP